MLASLRGLLKKKKNWGSFPFLLSPTLMATDWRGETFPFSSSVLQRSATVSHYRLMTFVGDNPFVEGKQFVCCSVEAFYSLLTCLCQCQGPWGKRLMCSEWLRFLAPWRTENRVRESNPTPPCSTSTKTRNECSHGISHWLFDMLTHQWCFEFCQGDFCLQESLHFKAAWRRRSRTNILVTLLGLILQRGSGKHAVTFGWSFTRVFGGGRFKVRVWNLCPSLVV